MEMRHTIRTAAMAVAMTVATHAHAAPTRPMTFEIVEQGRTADGVTAAIYASGDITDGTAKRFEDMVGRNHITQAMVSFDSGGGLVVESVRLGQLIRRLGFGTSVQRAVALGGSAEKAYCASACVYAYAGGVARYLDDAAGRLGVHQYYGSAARDAGDSGNDLKVSQLMGSVIVAHLHQMGVSSALYVAAAITDSRTMLWLDRKEAEDFDLVNNGEMPPEAEIMLTDDGHPYLEISQVADRGRTTIAISCTRDGISVIGGATGDRDALRRVRSQAVRSNFEIDGVAVRPGTARTEIGDLGGRGLESDSLDATSLARVNKAGSIGFSIDDISGRWRRSIDVHTLRDKIAYYTRTCRTQG
jgi:hypothetical protein